MTTTCCPPAPRAMHHPHLLNPGLDVARRAWAAWRAASRRRAELQALEPLDDRMRRDLGLPERASVVSQRLLWHYERGQW